MKVMTILFAVLAPLWGGAQLTADPPAPETPAPAPAAKAAVPEWAKVSKEQVAEAERLKVPVAFENVYGMRFVLVPAGSFLMGSPATEAGREEAEGPQHKVTLTKSYYVSIHETTNAQWLKFDDNLPSLAKYAGEDRPVNYISYVTAHRFLKWLNAKDPGHAYALPTEAQWEYACRAGGKTPFSTGETLTKEQANFGDREGTTKSVGAFAPNAWGLYDMHGNVLEWCADFHGTYKADDAVDPSGAASGETRALRGGSWVHEAKSVRCAARHQTIHYDEYHVAGFRLVASAAAP